MPLSYPQFRRYQELTRSFSSMAAYQPVPLDLLVGERIHRLRGQLVTSGFFDALAPRFEVGRQFTQEESEGETGQVVVLSETLRRRYFGGRDLLGDRLVIEETPFTVVGLVDERFGGPVTGEQVDLWLPVSAAPIVMPSLEPDALRDPTVGWLFWMVARLAPGVDLATAQRDLDDLRTRLTEADEATSGFPGLQVHGRIGLRPGTAGEVTRPLLLLLGVCLLLLLIACVNLGGLLLSRAITRSEELSVRLALGASRWHLVRQLLTESLILAVSGGVLGVLAAIGVAGSLEGSQLARFIPAVSDLGLGYHTLGAALAVVLLSAAMFGLAPAVWAVRREARAALVPGADKLGAPQSVRRWLEVFVVAQLAGTFGLLLITASLVGALSALRSTDPGFDPADVLNVRLDLAGERYTAPRREALVAELLEAVESFPGVVSTATASAVPLDRGGTSVSITTVSPTGGAASLTAPPFVRFAAVTGEYFQTLRIPILEGREFTEGPAAPGESEVVINRALSDDLWPGQDAVGRGLEIGGAGYRVVGVAESVHQGGLDEPPEPFFYVHGLGSDLTRLTLHVRSSIPPTRLAAPIRERIAGIDPQLPVFETTPFEVQIEESLAQPRLLASLFGAFSGLALLISLLGLGGALAFSVRARRHEFGVRLVLGARREDLLRRVIATAGLVTGLAILLGFGLAIAVARTMQSFLYGVAPADSLRAAGLAVIFLVASLAVSAVPAWMGSRVDPRRSIYSEQATAIRTVLIAVFSLAATGLVA